MTSYSFRGSSASGALGVSVSNAGDVDGDGIQDYLIGDSFASGGGKAYLIKGRALARLDSSDGSLDHTVYLDSIAGQRGVYTFENSNSLGQLGVRVGFGGNLDDDGHIDIMLSDHATDNGRVFLLATSELDAMDAADGTQDGVINVANASYTLSSDDNSLATPSPQLGFDFNWLVNSEEFLIGAPGAYDTGQPLAGGELWTLANDDLAALDALDGNADGQILLSSDLPPEVINGTLGARVFYSQIRAGNAGTGISVIQDGAQTSFLSTAAGTGYVVYLPEADRILDATGLNSDSADGTLDHRYDLDFSGFEFHSTLGELNGTASGDFNGDGITDYVFMGSELEIDPRNSTNEGAVFLVNGDLVETLDAADGASDTSIFLEPRISSGAVYRISGTIFDGRFGADMVALGDLDGDGKTDFAISAPNTVTSGTNLGRTYVIYSTDLRAADRADGTVDGDIQIDNLLGTERGYTFVGAQPGNDLSSDTQFGGTSAGTLFIGDPQARLLPNLNRDGAAYAIALDEMAALDMLDGTRDHQIDLDLVSAIDSTGLSVIGTSGNDDMAGFTGNDTIAGGRGDDYLKGRVGNDKLNGGAGDDRLSGGQDSDVLRGGGGNDSLFGDDGPGARDKLFGDAGNDMLRGGGGSDILNGGKGHDALFGGNGNDRLMGQGGRDTLDGGRGDDLLNGGGGRDTFVFENKFGDDTIQNFEDRLDKIDLSGLRAISDYDDLVLSHMSQSGSDVLIEAGRHSILIENTQLADLSEDTFIF